MPASAMVLAAGLGLRMRPLTLSRPKPLVAVAGRALIDHVLDRVAEAQIAHAVVNVHHFADRVEAHLAQRRAPKIAISDERDLLLDSGGGVARALPLLSGEHFVVTNADSFWIDAPGANLRALAAGFDAAAMDVLLLLVPREAAVGFSGPGDFFRTADGRLTRRGAHAQAPFVYAGCALLARRLFADVPAGPFSLNLVFDRALAAGRLHGRVLDGLWLHVGTPEAITLAEAAIAAQRVSAS